MSRSLEERVAIGYEAEASGFDDSFTLQLEDPPIEELHPRTYNSSNDQVYFLALDLQSYLNIPLQNIKGDIEKMGLERANDILCGFVNTAHSPYESIVPDKETNQHYFVTKEFSNDLLFISKEDGDLLDAIKEATDDINVFVREYFGGAVLVPIPINYMVAGIQNPGNDGYKIEPGISSDRLLPIPSATDVFSGEYNFTIDALEYMSQTIDNN